MQRMSPPNAATRPGNDPLPAAENGCFSSTTAPDFYPPPTAVTGTGAGAIIGQYAYSNVATCLVGFGTTCSTCNAAAAAAVHRKAGVAAKMV